MCSRVLNQVVDTLRMIYVLTDGEHFEFVENVFNSN